MIKLSLLFGFIIGLSYFEGGLVTLFCQDRSRHQIVYILQPFSSGALISLALVHLMPVSLKLLPWSAGVFLITISGLMVLSEFGKPDKFLMLAPKWGQRFLSFIYSLSLGVLIGIGVSNGFRMAIIGTIVAIPTQFIQALKGFIYKTGYLGRSEFIKSLFLTSLIVPFIILIIRIFHIYLNPAVTGMLYAFIGGVFLFQAILEFQTYHPYTSLIGKILYFIAGIFTVYCL